MKKGFFVLITIMVFSIPGVSIFSASTAVSQTGKPTSVNIAIPDSINLILTKSCTPCHSGSNIIASSHFNITKWAEYTSNEQVKKGTAICEIITKGDMPPKSVRNSKPEMIPTESQLAMICKWVNSLSVK
jgi:hypothetical protein